MATKPDVLKKPYTMLTLMYGTHFRLTKPLPIEVVKPVKF